jgi:hypothetical protein
VERRKLARERQPALEGYQVSKIDDAKGPCKPVHLGNQIRPTCVDCKCIAKEFSLALEMDLRLLEGTAFRRILYTGMRGPVLITIEAPGA